jgi:hypothetical protein
LISKFRFFENGSASADAKDQIESYIDEYTCGPLSKAELLNRIAEGRDINSSLASKF